MARASAPLRSLSLGRRRSTRVCFVTAPCRAGCGRFMHYERPLHRREASLLRCADVVRRASRGHPEPAGICVGRAGLPLRSLSLRERRSTKACCARAPCHAGCGRSTQHETALHRREASPTRRTAVVRRASGAHPESAGFSGGTRERATALAISREDVQHASFLRMRAVPRWLWSVHAIGRVNAPARPLSFGARPWCDVPAGAIQNQPAFALSRGTRERATALAVSRVEA